MMSHGDWITVVWATGIPLLVVIGVAGLGHGIRNRPDPEEESVDVFITAREQVGTWRMTWAFFGAVMGSWVLTRPGYLGASTGLLGVSIYALSAGLAVLILAAFGAIILNTLDTPAASIGDFFRWRFGPLAQVFVATLVVFNMTVLLLAEYTNLISIFEGFVDTGYFAIVVFVGFLALVYTVYGGLPTTIAMNQFQALLTLILTICIGIYVGTTFDRTMPKALTSKQTGLSSLGSSTIVIFPVTVLATALFSENIWQRCWASSGSRQLLISSSLSSLIIALFVFAFGAIALLGQWTSPIPTVNIPAPAKISIRGSYNPFYTFFQILPKRPVANIATRINSWGGLVSVLLSIVLSQSHVAALQSGLTNTLSAYFVEDSPLFVIRTISLLVNIPILGIALRNVPIARIYHLSNMLCTLSMIPGFCGLIPALFHWYTGDMMFYAVVIGFVGSTGYGISVKWNAKDRMESLKAGLNLIWWNDRYNYKHVLAILFCSILGVLITMILGLPFTACQVQVGSLSDIIYKFQQKVLALWRQPTRPSKEEDMEQQQNLRDPNVKNSIMTRSSMDGGEWGPPRDPSFPSRNTSVASQQIGTRQLSRDSSDMRNPLGAPGNRPVSASSQGSAPSQGSAWARVQNYQPRVTPR